MKSGTIIAAWAERAHGPGWSNTPVWVLVQEDGGRYRLDALQPHQLTDEIRALYAVSEAAHSAMLAAVYRARRVAPLPREA